jgi:hypothetical protein
MNSSGLIGLVLVLLAAGLLLGLTFIRRRSATVFREIPAFSRLKRAIGVSVEAGTRLHISLGRSGLQTPEAAPGLAGLAMLRYLSEQTSASDKPPVVSSGAADLAILSRDTLQAGYKAAGAEELYEPNTGRLTGLTPFSFVAGALPLIKDEDVSANVFIGHFGPEVALLTDAAERAGSPAVAGAADPAAQALIYASVDNPLIGEELFAAGAYTNAGNPHQASLQAQDILRWVIILILLIGSGLALVGVRII